MNKQHIHAHCRQCKHEQSFERLHVNHALHALLTLCTLGFWIISWISITVGSWFRPWRCHHCGWHDPEFQPLHLKKPGEPRWPAEEPRGRRRAERSGRKPDTGAALGMLAANLLAVL